MVVSGLADSLGGMSEVKSERISVAVAEAARARRRHRAVVARRNWVTRLVYWTDRLVEELEAQNQSGARRVDPRTLEELESLMDVVPFDWPVRATRRSRPTRVLDEVFEIQARLLELKAGGRTPEMQAFDASLEPRPYDEGFAGEPAPQPGVA
jgi:hypothetical protein